MSDETSDLTIIADIAGRPQRLASAKQWRAVITRCQLERDTPVKLEYRSGRIEAARAGDCAALQPLFDELVGPEVSPSAAIEIPVPPERISEPPPTPIVEPSRPIVSLVDRTLADKPGAQDHLADAAAPPDEISPVSQSSERVKPVATAQPAQNTAPTPPVKKEPSWGARLAKMSLLIGAVALVRVCSASSGVQPVPQQPSPTASPSFAQSASDAATALPSATASPTEPAATYYAARPVAIYTQASDTSPLSTQPPLNRGDTVSGVAENADWIRIVAGAAAGNYVSRAAFRSDAPPAIDTTTAGDYYLVTSAALINAPTDAATAVTNYAAGTKLTVQGTVNGFAEVSAVASGVGYIPWAAFGGEGGKGEKHFVRLYNNCSTNQKVILSLRSDGNWQGSGFWPVSVGQNAQLTSNTSQPLEADSAEFYYSLLSPSFNGSVAATPNKDQALVDQQVKQLRRAVPVLNNGEYIITLCSGRH